MSARSTRRRMARGVIVIGLALALLSTTGCVYLRLLQLKRQMARFDANFSTATDDGVRIRCRHPVLLRDDVRWIGLAPEKTTTTGDGENWQVRWVKQLPPGVPEQGRFDVVVHLRFSDEKLSGVDIPERYFALMPKSLLVDMLRSLGGGRVDRDARSVEARLRSARPDLPAMLRLLGAPTAREADADHTSLRYRYVPATATGLARSAVFDMTIQFDTASGRLLRWQGRTPAGKVGFNFEDPAADPSTSGVPPG